MIPNHILKIFEDEKIPFYRSSAEREEAIRVLHSLDLSEGDEVFDYFAIGYGANLTNARASDELLDLGDADFLETFDYMRDRYDLTAEWLPLTSDQAEVFFLYHLEDGAVYDYDMTSGDKQLRWPHFYDYLSWYSSDY